MKPSPEEAATATREQLAAYSDKPPDDAIQLVFEAYHEANPHVYKLLVRYTREAVTAARARGRELNRYGIQAVAERVRWHVNFEAQGLPEFKLSNNLLSRYARLIMSNEADLRGLFELRKLRTYNDEAEKETSQNGDSNDDEGRGEGRREGGGEGGGEEGAAQR